MVINIWFIFYPLFIRHIKYFKNMYIKLLIIKLS